MLKLRSATAADSDDFFAWRNDPDTRAASGNSGIVTIGEHVEWFSRALGDSRRFLYVAEEDGPPARTLGMCRFDVSREGAHAEVSINLAAAARGKGLADPILRAAIGQFELDYGGQIRLTATIRKTNGPSIHLFAKVGFVHTTDNNEFSYFAL